MKILWASCSFLHPTTRGGQIRTLEMLRRLHRRHEIHYAALADPSEPEGVARAGEYSTRVFPFEFRPVPKGSPRFAAEILAGAVSPLPLAISRWRHPEMRRSVGRLLRDGNYDCVVCDFLVTAINLPSLDRAVLFQHNVESVIWQRHSENATGPLRRFYYRLQERRMAAFEASACGSARRVIAVSDQDAATMRRLFGVDCAWVPTGVDLEYFQPPHPSPPVEGLVFVGSMDWMPNIDGVNWFLDEVLPLVRASRPLTPVTIAGRKPGPALLARAAADPLLRITGTVPDVRPHLWSAAVSIVPLRIGGGTRLKIYESMAANVPVVSTSIGAEGLDVLSGRNILLGDTAQAFAAGCIELLGDPGRRRDIAAAGHDLVATRYSWEQVARRFEQLLPGAPDAVEAMPA
jgi:glycosyltransferase involved in cell wall biosynthesis